MVVGRRVLGAYVNALAGGTGLKGKPSGDDVEDEAKWAKIGEEAFKGESGAEQRGAIVEALLSAEGLAGWCEEQVSGRRFSDRGCQLMAQITTLRHLQSELLQADEEWAAAARALARIPLEGGSRFVADPSSLTRSLCLKCITDQLRRKRSWRYTSRSSDCSSK